MRVSIIFPLLVAIVIRIGGVPAFLLGLLLSYAACVIVPAYPDFSASYSLGIMLHIVACFIVGILLSSNLDRIAAWWKRSPSGIHWIVAVGSLGVYAYEKSITKRILPILFRGHSVSTSVHLILDSWLTLVGVCGFIVIALNAPIARQSLRRRVPQFLGKISYSLYLLHPVVLFALTFSCRNKISAWVQFPIYLSLSILVAWAFFLAVEEPFIRWSRSVR
jgi:peptidoglycan/LPS O-acetylase OafA/YrhL